ncbi:hypothetical protein DFH08DRAFT_819107 [Mycena albidolilacea]|uniref:Uncharacterized protein n=1 Tax=Mycena albidolilacea TaxID=1033008 RepID=A0AAD6ZFN7_9AGAR|nr:hypothetical protein DFH08DRAFT_819107 [Mycena albidolilacea]
MSRLPVFNFLLLFCSLLFVSGTQARVIIVTEHDHNHDDDDDEPTPDELKRRHILRIVVASVVVPSSILQPFALRLTMFRPPQLVFRSSLTSFTRSVKKEPSAPSSRLGRVEVTLSLLLPPSGPPPPMAAGYGPVSQAMPGYEAKQGAIWVSATAPDALVPEILQLSSVAPLNRFQTYFFIIQWKEYGSWVQATSWIDEARVIRMWSCGSWTQQFPGLGMRLVLFNSSAIPKCSGAKA